MSHTPEKFYDRLAAFYPVIDIFLKPQKRQLLAAINACAPGKLLEVGVGTGSHLKNYKKHEVTAVDTSDRMLAYARKHQTGKITLYRMNGEQLLFSDELFDYVVLAHVIAVVNDPEKTLNEVYRVLRPGGKLFILNHFTPNNWLKYLDRGFEKFARLIHLRSMFHVSSLRQLKKFRLIQDNRIGPFSYFKILIYEKNL